MREAMQEQERAADEQAMLAASAQASEEPVTDEAEQPLAEESVPAAEEHLPPDPDVLLEVRHLKKYFPAVPSWRSFREWSGAPPISPARETRLEKQPRCREIRH